MARIAITTSNSIRVKAAGFRSVEDLGCGNAVDIQIEMKNLTADTLRQLRMNVCASVKPPCARTPCK
jgi:hypothetical protein